MTADILALLSPQTPDTWPQGILAAADLREQRAKAATPGPYFFDSYCRISSAPRTQQYIEVENTLLPDASDEDWGKADFPETNVAFVPVRAGDLATEQGRKDAEHIAAEANPAHALAAVRRWRRVVERHGGRQLPTAPEGYRVCATCDQGPPPARHVKAPCPDLAETADEARAYVSGGPE